MFVRTNADGYLNLAHVVSITPDLEAGSGNWLIRTTAHAPGHAAAHCEIDPDDLFFALGHLIPAAPDAGSAYLLSYMGGAVEIRRSPIIAWFFPPDGSVYPLPVTPDFTVLDQPSFNKTLRWVLTDQPDGSFKGSNGGYYDSVDEAKAELLAVVLRNDPPG
jgi:hypothetical protein